MARIAYLVLAHNRPDELITTVQMLIDQGDFAVIHFDRNARGADFRKLQAAFQGQDSVAFTKRRKCDWGGWSLVGATLDMLRLAEASFESATHFYLISGACAPIKPRREIARILDENPRDYIEIEDLERSDWIKTGMKAERFLYRHYFNERTQSKLFYKSLALQKKYKLERVPPVGLEMKIGSQWWCLRRRTVEAVLRFIDENPKLIGFFKSVWIPDETFFQSLVARLVPEAERINRPPTLLSFTDYGLPVTFHADHFDMLTRQGGFFARKMSTTGSSLRSLLNAYYATEKAVSGNMADAKRHYQDIANAGRDGDRFGPRIWENSASVGRDCELILVSAKKWEEGDAIRRAISKCLDLPGVGYLFNSDLSELPELGGLELSAGKRNRHRRAVLSILFERFSSKRIAANLDPEASDIIGDLARDRGKLTIIYLDRDLDEDYFRGHARRTGQASDDISDDAWNSLYRTMQTRLNRNAAELKHPRLHRYAELRDADAAITRETSLARALDCAPELAKEILEKSGLYRSAS